MNFIERKNSLGEHIQFLSRTIFNQIIFISHQTPDYKDLFLGTSLSIIVHVSGNGIYCKAKQRSHSCLDPKNHRPLEHVEVES